MKLKDMKKIFAIVAVIATMILSASCGNRSSKNVEPAVDQLGVGLVDSTVVAVDSVAVDTVVAE